MDYRSSGKCTCADLDDVFVRAVIEDISALRGFLEPTTDRQMFRCSSCGQCWIEGLEPFLHADVPVVFKTWLNADGQPDPVGYDLIRRQLIRR